MANSNHSAQTINPPFEVITWMRIHTNYSIW